MTIKTIGIRYLTMDYVDCHKPTLAQFFPVVLVVRLPWVLVMKKSSEPSLPLQLLAQICIPVPIPFLISCSSSCPCISPLREICHKQTIACYERMPHDETICTAETANLADCCTHKLNLVSCWPVNEGEHTARIHQSYVLKEAVLVAYHGYPYLQN